MLYFKRAIYKIVRTFAYGGMWFCFPLIGVTVVDVLGRGLADKPLRGAFELSEYMLGIIVLSAVAFTEVTGGHVKVTLILDRVSSKTRSILEVISAMLSLLLFGFLSWRGAVEAARCAIVSDMLRIPQKPFRFLVPAACLLLLLVLLIKVYERLGNGEHNKG